MRLEFYQNIPAKLSYDLLSFTNTSPRYVINPVTGEVLGPFAANVPAIITIGGKRYLSSWKSLGNLLTYSNDLTNVLWKYDGVNGGIASIDGAALAPDGASGVSLLTTRNISAAGSRTHRTVTIPTGTLFSTWAKRGTQYSWACLRFGSPANPLVTSFVPPSVWTRYTRAIAGTNYYPVIYNDKNGDNDVPNPVTGDNVYYWCAQVEIANYPGRPIPTTSESIVTNKDQCKLVAANVPDALKDKCTIHVIPEWSSDQVTTGDLRYIGEFADTTQNIKVYYNGTDKKIYVYGASALITSSATTHLAGQQLNVSLDRVAGTLKLNGFTTGNGTSTGTAWNKTNGILYVGQDATEANQFDGLIAEPEIW